LSIVLTAFPDSFNASGHDAKLNSAAGPERKSNQNTIFANMA
jgi:hypothetical protein